MEKRTVFALVAVAILAVLAAPLLLYPTPKSSPQNSAPLPRTDYVTNNDALICLLPFLDDAEAAVESRNEAWLNETDCVQAAGGFPMTILSGHESFHFSTTDRRGEIWRVRLYSDTDPEGITVYMRGSSARLTEYALAQPKKVLVGDYWGFGTRSAAEQKAQAIFARKPQIKDGMTVTPEEEETSGDHKGQWTLLLQASSLKAALNFCENTTEICLILDQ